jgi:hypothetical protein
MLELRKDHERVNAISNMMKSSQLPDKHAYYNFLMAVGLFIINDFARCPL